MKLELSLLALLLAACSGDSDAPPRKDPAVVLVPGDGGAGTAVTVPQGVDPSSVHIDDHSTYRQPSPLPLPGRDRRAIDVTLRSSPPGALAAVDGTPIGPTPAFWSGYADGREHQFVFTLQGHAIARYRFVPVSSGVIHARLDPIIEERDAGVTPPPEVVPQPSPSAIVPPASPPTIIDVDAAVAPPPGAADPMTGGSPVGPQP